MHLNTEKELFFSIAEGDEAAFRQLFHLYMPRLYPMILKVTKIESVTEDIIQETFLKLWINRDKLPEIENPWSWLSQIAYYQAFTFLRKKVIHEKAIDRISGKVHADALRNATEETITLKAMQRLIAEAITKMPGQQKKVYLLSREQGLKIPEIASKLALSEQSVKNTLVRALKFIRAHMEKSGHVMVSIIFMAMRFFNHNG